MKIDFKKLEMGHWFETLDGKIIPCEPIARPPEIDEEDILYYKTCFPLTYVEPIDEYCYHPEKPLVKWLMRKSRRFNRYMLRKHKDDKTFRTILTCRTGYNSDFSQRCIMAMVNSGDYTLAQAVYAFANSCERCMNALLYKYLNGEDGYPEYSEEWQNCNTVCDWCREEKPNEEQHERE